MTFAVSLHAGTFWGSSEAARLRQETPALFVEADEGSPLKHDCTTVGLGFDFVQMTGSERSTGVFVIR
jgi:hypothetical protein